MEYAHERGVTVEGEIGVLGGVEDGHGAGGTGLEHITDPDQAVEFAERTGVDALAIAIGTSHGAYKFTKKPDGSVLKMDVLIAIHKRLPNTHLVMHGSSSVPKDLQDIINQYGGKLKETWGVPVEEIQLGIRNGVRKINVDTDNRLAITGAIRKVFAETPEKFDPRDYLKPAREAMKKVVAQRMTQFGQAGHAGDYKPVAIAEIAKGYAAARWTPVRRLLPSNRDRQFKQQCAVPPPRNGAFTLCALHWNKPGLTAHSSWRFRIISVPNSVGAPFMTQFHRGVGGNYEPHPRSSRATGH